VQKDTKQEVDDVSSAKPAPGEGAGAARTADAAAEAAKDVTAKDVKGPPGNGEVAAAVAAADGAPAAAAEPAAEAASEVPDGAAEGDQSAAEQSKVIEADLASVRAEAAGYLNDLRRLQAEFDNYRKRMLREQTARVASASQSLVSKLLPVLDNFELAVSHAEQSRDFDRMLKGVEMVFGELQEVLRGEGLSRIEAEGKPFDPERHEAVVAVEQEGAEAGSVVDVVRTGYELQGKVLRPAMVKVAR